jgi:hypothetical protein
MPAVNEYWLDANHSQTPQNPDHSVTGDGRLSPMASQSSGFDPNPPVVNGRNRATQSGSGPLTRGLLVTVRPIRGNPTKSPRLLPRQASNGRLSVELKAVAAVDQRTVTEVAALEIRSCARWQALPLRRCSVLHCAERRHDADRDSCRDSCIPSSWVCQRVRS